jgi:hypothetical protein
MQVKDDIELMQLHDGELQGETDDQAKLAALAEMGELLRGHLEAHAEAVPDHKFAAMWREISKAQDPQEDAPRGFWARLAAWLDRHRGHVITGMASAGAVAAIALVIRTRGGEVTSAPSSRSSIEVLPAAMRTAPVIESLDTPDGTGTVMNFEDEDGHTTVIWVTPADTVDGI